jgi:hypothetical protein
VCITGGYRRAVCKGAAMLATSTVDGRGASARFT